MTPQIRYTALSISLVAIIGFIFTLERGKPDQISFGGTPEIEVNSDADADKKTAFPKAVELVAPGKFINTEPLTIQSLIGKKVILVDFWTYSCINCQRTTPYLNAWYDKYADKGLEIIGVHTPEFAFEKEYDNVLTAVNKFKIKYPVVQDNDYATWNAYKNRYWPRKYLIDIDGYIVYDHIGEGAYEETEKKIQELLSERMIALGETGSIEDKITAEIPQSRAESPETYFGSLRNDRFGSGERGVASKEEFKVPETPLPNTLYLEGTWDITPEYAENTSGNAKIVYRYKAKEVYLVASALKGVRAKIFIDGKPITIPGADVTKDGVITIQAD